MKLSKEKIELLATRYANRAVNALKANRMDVAIRYTKAAAHTKYNFYLGFKDSQLESVVDELSTKIKKSDIVYNKNKNVCVFFDSFSNDNGGLVQQYLDALNYAGFEIIYISEKVGFEQGESAIKKQLVSYKNSRIIEIPNIPLGIKRCQLIYDTIIQTGASRVFMHTGPSAVCPVVAFHALPDSTIKYKINLTDHTFWLGANSVDYSLEFRKRGCVLTECQRGITRDKIFLIPFYPIQSTIPYRGFPEQTEGKVVILSGGAFYKVFDEKDTFFKIAKGILDRNKTAVIVFAGSGDSDKMLQKIKEYDLSDRFYLIGQRKDITEVFRHSDIFLNTAPLGGGLMCQLAAMNFKPILSYAEGGQTEAEELVCQRKYMPISHYSIESLVEESCRLVEDASYRSKKGEALHECTVDEEQFNILFKNTIYSNKNQLPYQLDESMNHNHMRIDDKIEYENINKFYQRSIVKVFGLPSVWRCPSMLIDSLLIALKKNKLKAVISNNIING